MVEAAEWRTICGWEKYEVNQNGEIRRIDSGRILKQQLDKMGYKVVSLGSSRRGMKKTLKVHRIVASAFIPNPEELPHINHLDCDPTNNAVGNLEWCDPARNTAHSAALGRMKYDNCKGKRSGRAKFTDAQVRQLRHERATLMTPIKTLATKYGVCERTIISAIHGKFYGDVR